MSRPPHRSKWPAGPWDDEPDREEFEHAGLPCVLLRHSTQGNWCGYVGLPPWHPAAHRRADLGWLAVHGGELTFWGRDKVDGQLAPGVALPRRLRDHFFPQRYLRRETARRLARAPAGLVWVGFACSHYGDLCPSDLTYLALDELTSSGEVYRDIAYVRGRTTQLAEQLASPRAQAVIWLQSRLDAIHSSLKLALPAPRTRQP